MNQKRLLEIRAVKFIARVLGVDYQGIHTGSDTSKADGEIRRSGKLVAVLEVTIDDDEVSEKSDSEWLTGSDKAYLELRVGSGSWRVGLKKGVRWNKLKKEDSQDLVDNMKLEMIQSVYSYDGISSGRSLDICNRLGITNIDFMDFEGDGIHRSFSTEPKHFDNTGDPYPEYIRNILITKKIQKKIIKLIDRANGSPTFLAIIVGSATELSARFGMVTQLDQSPLRTQQIELPNKLSAVYVLHPGAGHAIWFHFQTGWGEAKIDQTSVIALLQEALNERDK